VNGRATHFVIGVDANQDMVKPGFVLTSMIKRVDNAVYAIVDDVVHGRFQSGLHVYGLDKDGVGYSIDQYNKDLLTPEMLQAAEEAKKRIIAGQIKFRTRWRNDGASHAAVGLCTRNARTPKHHQTVRERSGERRGEHPGRPGTIHALVGENDAGNQPPCCRLRLLQGGQRRDPD
jgi:hypothetical protein